MKKVSFPVQQPSVSSLTLCTHPAIVLTLCYLHLYMTYPVMQPQGFDWHVHSFVLDLNLCYTCLPLIIAHDPLFSLILPYAPSFYPRPYHVLYVHPLSLSFIICYMYSVHSFTLGLTMCYIPESFDLILSYIPLFWSYPVLSSSCLASLSLHWYNFCRACSCRELNTFLLFLYNSRYESSLNTCFLYTCM